MKKKIKKEKGELISSTPYNQNTHETHLQHEKINSARNYRYIMDGITEGRMRDLDAEPKVAKNTPVFILGSGPSIDEAMPLFKEWQGGIICSTSQAPTLIYHGVEPDYIVGLDPFSSWDEIKNIDWTKTKSKLVVHPGVWPDLFKNWPNEVLLFRQFLGNHSSWYATDQKMMYSERKPDVAAECQHKPPQLRSLIPTEMTVFACGPPAQLYVAKALGYGVNFLSGCDFAFHSGKRRFTMAYPQEDGSWKIQESLVDESGDKTDVADETGTPTDPNTPDTPMMTENGLKTQRLMVYYKKNFLTAVRLSGQTTYVCGISAITELPNVPVAEVIAKQGHGYQRQKRRELVKWIEPYLAGVGCFVLTGPAGETFMETENPMVDCRNYIVQVLRTYRCGTCGLVGQASDDDEHTGQNCPRCPNGKWVPVNRVDMLQNMRRLARLVKGNAKPIGLLTDPELSIAPAAIQTGE